MVKSNHVRSIERYTIPSSVLRVDYKPKRISNDKEYIARDHEILELIENSGNSGLDITTGHEIAEEVISRYQEGIFEPEADYHEAAGRRLCRHYSVGPFWFKFAFTPDSLPELRKNSRWADNMEEQGALGYSPIRDWGPYEKPDENDKDLALLPDEIPDIFYMVMLRGLRLERLLMEGSPDDLAAANALTDSLGNYMFSQGKVQYGEQVESKARTYMDFMLHKLVGRAQDLESLIRPHSQFDSWINKLEAIREVIPRRIHPNEAVCWGFEDALLTNFIDVSNEDISYEAIKVIDQGYHPEKMDAWAEETNTTFDETLKLPHFQLGRASAYVSRLLSEDLSHRARKAIQNTAYSFVSRGKWDFHDEELKGTRTDWWSKHDSGDRLFDIIFKLGEVSVFQNTEITRNNIDAVRRAANLIDDVMFRLIELGEIEAGTELSEPFRI